MEKDWGLGERFTPGRGTPMRWPRKRASSEEPGLGGRVLPKPCMRDEGKPPVLEEWRRIIAGSSLLAELLVRTRSDARSVRPLLTRAMPASPADAGDSGGSDRPNALAPLPGPGPPPAEPRLPDGEDAAPCGESLLCCEPLRHNEIVCFI